MSQTISYGWANVNFVPKQRSLLLLVDATINLLGVLLLVFPASFVEAIGIPTADLSFYPSILGAVLFGIGLALLVQRRSPSGLGLAGAIVINLRGGITLALWLLLGSLALPTHGFIGLWRLAAVLVGLSAVELLAHGKRGST